MMNVVPEKILVVIVERKGGSLSLKAQLHLESHGN